MGIRDWKQYLSSKGLYAGIIDSNSDAAFKRAMVRLEDSIVERAPAVRGMIWRKGQINPRASIKDVDEALGLLSIGVANFDALGDPTDPEYIGTPFKQMFISQEDSKLDEYDPKNEQTHGRWMNPAPKDPKKSKKPQQKVVSPDADERMKALVEMMEEIETTKK